MLQLLVLGMEEGQGPRMCEQSVAPSSSIGVLFWILDLNVFLVVNWGELSLCLGADTNL